MIRRILLLFLFFGIFHSVQAQVIVKESLAISQMLQRYTEINKNTTKISGWRILVHATRDRVELENMHRKFQYNYPNIYSDWVHDPPYYKLRAGAFESKLDAQRLLYIIRRDYPNSSITKDNNMRPGELIF